MNLISFVRMNHAEPGRRFAAIFARVAIGVSGILASFVPAGALTDEAEEIAVSQEQLHFFESEIRPLLAENCYKCHGPEKQKGDLRLDHLQFMLDGGESGPAVVPGDLVESLLIEAVNYDFLEMPPDDPLSSHQVALLEKWVAMGAPWPKSELPSSEVSVEEPKGFTEEDYNQWSLQPIAKVKPPKVKGRRHSKWVQNPIDSFIAEKHREAGLTPAEPASRSELIRRATFDLHGLPPSPERIREFENDSSPDAYSKLLDELLSSPRYGERWGRHWLDLVRYADSDGYNQDAYRPSAWPYRDWVIESLNSDMPYDDFVRYQLAGDEIAPGDLGIMPATSFLRNGIYEYNLRDIRGQWDAILNDMTDVVGEVFLGRSFSCARCHDHKFDPILQKDYYRLRAFFEPILWRTDLKMANEKEIEEHEEKMEVWRTATKEIRDEIDQMVGEYIEEKVRVDRSRFPEDIQQMVNKPEEERSPLEKQYVMMAGRMPDYVRKREEDNAIKYLETEEEKKCYAGLLKELKAFDDLKPEPLLEAFVATDVGADSPPTILKTKKGEEVVEPGFMEILDTDSPQIEPLLQSTGRRRALAEWITDAGNPLSIRVIVNRVWQYHFGRGLAANANDLGNLGEAPSHPELLDWLALTFVEDGWSLKKLHKRIMESATYQQTALRSPPEIAAKVDPGNALLWRFSPQRLDAEQIRDAMLAASGELDLSVGGEGEVAQNSNRRSVYTIKKRNTPDELLNAMDAPLGFLSAAERETTTTPTQALLLINGGWTRDRAEALVNTAPDVEDAWWRVFGRPPRVDELARGSEFLNKTAFDDAYLMDLEEVDAVGVGEFKPNSPRERIEVKSAENQGEEFGIEAVITLGSQADEGWRTIASRWNGEQNSLEACGWSFAVSAPDYSGGHGSLVFQLVGVDENDAFRYTLVESELKIEKGKQYYVSAYLSKTDQTIAFRVQDLKDRDSGLKTEVVTHIPLNRISAGDSPLMIGGITGSKDDLFEGRIDAIRLSVGPLPGESPFDWEQWEPSHFLWTSSQASHPSIVQRGVTLDKSERDPRRLAKVDLYHVLLNANEFFYLH